MIKIRLDPTLPDADLSLRLFIGCQDHFNTYVHPAAIVGGTTCPYEQLTPTSPTIVEIATFETQLSNLVLFISLSE